MEPLEIKAFGFEPDAPRNVFHLALPRLEAFPAHLPMLSPKFTLFLACDSRNIPLSALDTFAKMALAQGAVYVCTWGPDCERVHDIFDEAIVERVLDSGKAASPRSTITTTWHHGETLEEALDFFLTAAAPGDDYAAGCEAALVISVDNQERAVRIDNFLSSQVPPGTRTYIYSSDSDGIMWMRDDFDEPLEEFAEST